MRPALRPVTRLAALVPLLLVLGLGGAPGRTGALANPRPEGHPNILLVTIDTLRADRVGAYGSRRALTPVMDRLGAEGVVFDHAMVQVPLTRPSHVSLLTGKLPFQHGIRDNFSFSLAPEHHTLAEVLKGRGYATGGFVAAFMLNAESGLNRGFDAFDDAFDGAAANSAFLAEHQRRAAEVERRAGAWIERAARGKQPFFAWVHFYDPHSPYDPPPPYAARYAANPYDGEVAYTDAALGRLLARLDRLGIRGSTLVVVTSDHGEGLGEHGEAEHGFFLYETTLRVPLIARWPGALAAGTRVGADARSIDILPTILDLVGERAATPAGIAGQSLLSALPVESGFSRSRQATEPGRAGGSGSYAETLFPRIHFDCSDLRSVTVGGWKYIEAPRPELYDLRADPAERMNLYASEGQRARTMRSRLLDVMGGSLETALVGAASPKLDAETQRRLASLGYVSGSGGSGGRGDPKDAIADFQSFTRGIRGAFEAYDRGDLKAAISAFESAVAGGRAAFDVYYYLGSAYLKLGQPARAVAPLREAIRKNASYTPSSLELAAVYIKLERLDEAMAVLREALANDPRSFQLHSHLGYAARLRRDIPTARQEYEAARALNPRDFDVRMNLSSIYRDGGDVSRALEEVDAALEMRPDSADAHNQRGMLLGGTGRFREAAGAFERATALASGNAQFWYNLGLARFKAGDRPRAAEALRRTLALKPDFADARTLLGEVSRK